MRETENQDNQTQDASFSNGRGAAQTSDEPGGQREQQLKSYATTVYVLQAMGFLLGITWAVALIIAYIKRDQMQGTWLESHARWQIRTFWFGFLWFFLGALTTPILIGLLILLANYLWLIYRVAKGWLTLVDNEPMIFLQSR